MLPACVNFILSNLWKILCREYLLNNRCVRYGHQGAPFTRILIKLPPLLTPALSPPTPFHFTLLIELFHSATLHCVAFCIFSLIFCFNDYIVHNFECLFSWATTPSVEFLAHIFPHVMMISSDLQPQTKTPPRHPPHNLFLIFIYFIFFFRFHVATVIQKWWWSHVGSSHHWSIFDFIDSLPAVVHNIFTTAFFCVFSQQIPDEFDKGEYLPDSKLMADCVHRICCRARCVEPFVFVCRLLDEWPVFQSLLSLHRHL